MRAPQALATPLVRLNTRRERWSERPQPPARPGRLLLTSLNANDDAADRQS
jgi:hypothetical protein